MPEAKQDRPPHSDADGAPHFIFCTGIENSYPIITDHKGRDLRRDGLELSEHYQRWRHDFRLVKDLGINYLRYGPPYYSCHVGPGEYDWSFTDKTFAELQRLGIEPITDLCHFGLPDWLGGSFQNPQWPPLFAQYARAFAERFPWVRLYTPVNEIFICAQFSALNGWWNERLKSQRDFVTALKHMCRAAILAREAILQVRPDALFIQSESSTYCHPAVPAARTHTDFYNEQRFLALDLCHGRDVDGRIYGYLLDNGLGREEYQWFMDHGAGVRAHCIIGSDYYSTNEKKIIDDAGTMEPSGEVLGYYVIARQYFERYRLPIFHTETNRKNDADAPRWLYKEWFNILRLKADGIPSLGFTWYSLLDQTDWDIALREDNERINPMGLYDLQRNIRPVGAAYRDLIAAWREHLPLESLTRDLAPDSGSQRSAQMAGAAKNGKSGARHETRHGRRRHAKSGEKARAAGDGFGAPPVHPAQEKPPKPSRRKVAESD
jgi:beta-glucosidase/6-phospho-beta-glucosidase/beta-galactosidase